MPAEDVVDYAARAALMDSIRRDESLFAEKAYRVGFPNALRAFSRATSIEASGKYKVGLVATENKEVHNYIQVACKTSPPDTVEEVSGWRKINDNGFWTYTPNPLDSSSSFPGDLEPIEVCFEAADKIELEAMVGRCMMTTKGDTGTRCRLTQGLVIRALNTRWAITVGHGFSNQGRTHAGNAVQFCTLVPEGTPNGAECTACQQNKCTSVCETVNRVTVASGAADIITFNPKPTELDLDWMDFGLHKVPYNPAIKLTKLVVSDIILKIEKQLKGKNPEAYDELAGPQNGLVGVGDEFYSYKLAQTLMKSRPEGVYLFQRGKTTGWTFARLYNVTDTIIRANYILPTTQPGDCGGIWWIIDAEKHRAFPLGYHYGRADDVALIAPYLTALEQLMAIDTRFNTYQFVHGDSYVWDSS
ncbi:hypothetical protein TWF281_002265 [Arthrobotrys megalospora]